MNFKLAEDNVFLLLTAMVHYLDFPDSVRDKIETMHKALQKKPDADYRLFHEWEKIDVENDKLNAITTYLTRNK